MAATPAERRRRAACAVLEPVLSEDALLDALWHQHDHMRSDAVSDIIRFIDQVAERHLLDAPTRKRLYDGYFKAMQRPEDELPMDPWPLMQTARAPQKVSAPPPSPIPPPRAAIPAPVPAGVQPSPTGRAPAPPDLPPASIVFGLLWGTVLNTVHTLHQRDFADLCVAVQDELKSARVPAGVMAVMAAGWTGDPLQQQWTPAAKETELADMVHRLYVALCETLGPVAADQVLTHAVRTVERKPEASGFSPRKLL